MSGTNESGWVAQFGIAEYMHMASPGAPMNLLAEVAPERNDCYEYNNSALTGCARVFSETTHPSNTEGYYIRDEVLLGEYDEYQSPMFLMKYFVAIPAKNSGVDGYSFAQLNVAPYLELVKTSILLSIPELELDIENLSVIVNMDRVYHPHLPETYRFITENITQSAFQ